MTILIQLAMILLLAGATLLILKRRNVRKSRYVYAAAFHIALMVAILLKMGLEKPLVHAVIPFYKLFNIHEFGYGGLFADLIGFALPFVLPGLLFIPALPKRGIFVALLAGIGLSLFLDIPEFIFGSRFVTDEYLYAGIGLAAGCALYAIVITLLHRSKFIGMLYLPRPRRRAYTIGIAYCVVLYLGIALILIADYGQTYAPIQFYESETALPKDYVLSCELSDEKGKAIVYAPSTQPVEERASVIALALGISGKATPSQGIFVAESDGKKLSYTESGSWTYEYNGYDTALPAPSKESATAAVFDFFESRTLLTVKLDQVTDIVERHTDDGKFIGYDIYLSTKVNGHPIVGSCALVVSVRANNEIARIRKYDGDLAVEADRNILSQREAYARFEEGNCAYTLFNEATAYTIDACELIYIANSSQGYFLPVWSFRCTAKLTDGSETAFDIYVEALS